MDAKTVSLWITLLTIAAGGGAKIQSLDEARTIASGEIAKLTARCDHLQERIDALERDRSMLERLHQIELRLAAIEGQLKERRR